MIPIKDSFYSSLFALAGLWNVAIGMTGLLFTDFSIALFYGPAAVTGDFVALLSFRLFMVAIIAFGIGYYLVSRDTGLNRGIVCLGLACKMILFAVYLCCYFTGRATVMAALAVTGDFLWSLLFGLFLYRTRKSVRRDFITG
ncbi:MAG TPA: hypothetical protein PK926_15660 [Spirochaetota bacterium]|nr:hypothetical protein [Spirochaetota bacterium]